MAVLQESLARFPLPSLLDRLEQVCQTDPQPPGDLGNDIQGRIALPALERTHISTVYADGVGETLLGVVCFFP